MLMGGAIQRELFVGGAALCGDLRHFNMRRPGFSPALRPRRGACEHAPYGACRGDVSRLFGVGAGLKPGLRRCGMVGFHPTGTGFSKNISG